jgi:hypothetical protein
LAILRKSFKSVPEKYFHDYKGFHITGNGVNFWSSQTSQPSYRMTNLALGVGYGRVIALRPAAQAVAMASELNAGMTNEEVLKLAEIIEREGEYNAKYKDDKDIRFYGDLPIC